MTEENKRGTRKMNDLVRMEKTMNEENMCDTCKNKPELSDAPKINCVAVTNKGAVVLACVAYDEKES